MVAQSEGRRKQATAIILLGVIGAYHGQDAAEGFGLGSLSMQTSKSVWGVYGGGSVFVWGEIMFRCVLGVFGCVFEVFGCLGVCVYVGWKWVRVGRHYV